MTAPYAEAYGAGGPDDDGVGVAIWLAFRDCAALQGVQQAARDRESGAVLNALLTPVQPPSRGQS